MKKLFIALASVSTLTALTTSKIFAAGEATEETPAADSGTSATPPSTTPATGTDASTTTPKKVKKKKKKATAGVASDGTVTEGATGHGSQESGAPYKANVELDLGFNSQSTSQKYKDNTFKQSSSSLDLSVSWLFVLGRMEVGPQISYSSTTSKSAGSSETSKTSGIGLGAALFLNLGNINTDKTVPYAGLSLARRSSSTDGSVKSSESAINLGIEGGLKYFVGAHLAIKPFLSYDMTVNGESKDETGGSTTVASLTGSSLNLGLGLAKYF